MMLEGPTVQGAIGRLGHPVINLAAWGLTLSLSLLIESPVIMLLATAIALVRDAGSYYALRRFMVLVSLACTAVTGAIAFTPLFDFVAGTIMRQPAPIVEAARPAMRIMLLWTAAIAWRRFYQGILVRCGRTRFVSYGTAVRLTTVLAAAAWLASRHHWTGVQVGAIAIMAAVLAEAVATTLFALPVVREEVICRSSCGPLLSQRDIIRFHAPLAAATMLTLLAQPLTMAALARLAAPKETLAAWPVVFMLMLVLRGWGLALQEISVSCARDHGSDRPLRTFAWIVGGVTAGTAVLVAFTPLLEVYVGRVLNLPEGLRLYVRTGTALCVALPLVTALGSWARGLLVAHQITSAAYRGMGVNLATHAGVLVAGYCLRLPGIVTASAAFTLASLGELGYLARAAAALGQTHDAVRVFCAEPVPGDPA